MYFIALLFVFYFPNEQKVFAFLGVSVLTLFAVFRVFGLKTLFLSVLTPLVYVGSTFFVFLEFPQVVAPFKIILTLLFSAFYYYLLLSVNSLCIAAFEKKTFPLVRVGKTLIYVTTLFASFLSATIMYKFEYNSSFYFFIAFLVSFLLSLEYFWSQQVGVLFFESLLISLIVAEISLALSFYPAEAFFRGLFVASTFFALLGIAESIISHKINRRIYLQYIFILLFVLIILIAA